MGRVAKQGAPRRTRIRGRLAFVANAVACIAECGTPISESRPDLSLDRASAIGRAWIPCADESSAVARACQEFGRNGEAKESY